MSLNDVTPISPFPDDATILRNIAASIELGDFKSKGLVVVMLTDEGIETFGSGKVGEEQAIQLLARAEHKLIKMLDELND